MLPLSCGQLPLFRLVFTYSLGVIPSSFTKALLKVTSFSYAYLLSYQDHIRISLIKQLFCPFHTLFLQVINEIHPGCLLENL